MTIDERLERLVERHEALAQTVELMAVQNQATFSAIAHNFEVCLDSIQRLERIAGSHEQRIEDLEHGTH